LLFSRADLIKKEYVMDWYYTRLFAIGHSDTLKELERDLQSLFDLVLGTERGCESLLAQVAKRGEGSAPLIEIAIKRYRHVIFSGLLIGHSSELADGYWTFIARNGEVEWCAFDLSLKDGVIFSAEIEGKLSGLDGFKPTIVKAEPAK
jgi:hypothetical protein